MNHSCRLRHFRPAILLFAVLLSACDKPAPPAAANPPSPEESFEFIVTTIRRGIETASSGIVPGGSSQGDDGYTAVSINNKVDDEYIAPAKESDAPRGRITIERESEVTIQPGGRNNKDGDEQRGSNGPGTALADGSVNVESMKNTARNQARQSEGPSLSEAPLPLTSKVSTDYELIHRNGRWQLETKIDQEKNPAIFEAFDYALKMQL
jgi:hypothetical protein